MVALVRIPAENISEQTTSNHAFLKNIEFKWLTGP